MRAWQLKHAPSILSGPQPTSGPLGLGRVRGWGWVGVKKQSEEDSWQGWCLKGLSHLLKKKFNCSTWLGWQWIDIVSKILTLSGMYGKNSNSTGACKESASVWKNAISLKKRRHIWLKRKKKKKDSFLYLTENQQCVLCLTNSSHLLILDSFVFHLCLKSSDPQPFSIKHHYSGTICPTLSDTVPP